MLVVQNDYIFDNDEINNDKDNDNDDDEKERTDCHGFFVTNI